MKDIDKLSKIRCEKILDWASDKDWFESTFIEDMYDLLERDQELTNSQVLAINNIFQKFVKGF